MKQIILSPSDFTFLWERDQWAFYEKYHHQIRRPRMNMPQVVGEIDGTMKGSLDGKKLSELDPELPAARIILSDTWVQSKPIVVGDLELIVRGKIDAALDFEDGTYGVVDYKASNKMGQNMVAYTRQLQAYAYAMSHNDDRDVHLSPITRLGVLQYKPCQFKLTGDGKAAMIGDIKWVELENNMADFVHFIVHEVAPFLMRDDVEPPENDAWLDYVECYQLSEEE
jgi:hypothetical protein